MNENRYGEVVIKLDEENKRNLGDSHVELDGQHRMVTSVIVSLW